MHFPPEKTYIYFIIDPKRAVSFETWYKPTSIRNEAKESFQEIFNLGRFHLGYCFILTFINSDVFVTKSVSQETKFNYSIFTMKFFFI